MALGSEVQRLENAGVVALHFDVMDGNFCPLLTFGPPVIKGLRTQLLKDVHLVVRQPLEQLEAFVAAGADILSFHAEATPHPHRALQALGRMTNANDPQRGIVRGVALNPGTPLAVVEPLLDEVDLVTLLAVNPGWGGQKFIAATAGRVARLLDLIRAAKRDVLVCIDGGVTRENIADIVRLAPDMIVTGSAVFDGKDAAANARQMLAAVREAHKH
jgi:ribulose-phosphate 3-epimerase